MAQYEIHVTSKDHIGMNFLENVIAVAATGAVQKEGIVPFMRFPFMTIMTIETDVEPTPTPQCRVFNMDEGKREIKIKRDEAPTGFSFDMGSSLMDKDSLDALDWNAFKETCKSVGISGRDRAQMTKKFLDYQESQE